MNKLHILLYQAQVKNPAWIREVLLQDDDIVVHPVSTLESWKQSYGYTPYCVLYECDVLHFSNLEELKANQDPQIPCLILTCGITDHIHPNELKKWSIIYKPNTASATVAFANMLRVNIRFIRTMDLEPRTMKQDGMVSSSIVAIGASTGGPHALVSILKDLPVWMCGIVIVQHMTQANTHSFAAYLDRLCQMKVMVAGEDMIIRNGVIYIARQHQHLVVNRKKDGFHLHYQSGPKIHSVCPSIDVLFQSLARDHDIGSIGILLTGMGADGAQGLLEMKNAGIYTIIQDKDSCELYSMPKEAKKLHAHQSELALKDISGFLLQRFDYLNLEKEKRP